MVLAAHGVLDAAVVEVGLGAVQAAQRHCHIECGTRARDIWWTMPG